MGALGTIAAIVIIIIIIAIVFYFTRKKGCCCGLVKWPKPSKQKTSDLEMQRDKEFISPPLQQEQQPQWQTQNLPYQQPQTQYMSHKQPEWQSPAHHQGQQPYYPSYPSQPSARQEGYSNGYAAPPQAHTRDMPGSYTQHHHQRDFPAAPQNPPSPYHQPAPSPPPPPTSRHAYPILTPYPQEKDYDENPYHARRPSSPDPDHAAELQSRPRKTSTLSPPTVKIKAKAGAGKPRTEAMSFEELLAKLPGQEDAKVKKRGEGKGVEDGEVGEGSEEKKGKKKRHEKKGLGVFDGFEEVEVGDGKRGVGK